MTNAPLRSEPPGTKGAGIVESQASDDSCLVYRCVDRERARQRPLSKALVLGLLNACRQRTTMAAEYERLRENCDVSREYFVTAVRALVASGHLFAEY